MDADLYVVHVDLSFGPRASNPNGIGGESAIAKVVGAQVVRLKGKAWRTGFGFRAL